MPREKTVTVHELRHTHASLLFEAGQSVKVVQERLGHASAQVTLNTYAHLLHDAQSRAAAALDDLLAAGQPDRTREVKTQRIARRISSNFPPWSRWITMGTREL